MLEKPIQYIKLKPISISKSLINEYIDYVPLEHSSESLYAYTVGLIVFNKLWAVTIPKQLLFN